MVYTMSTMVDLLSEFDLDDGEKDNILYKYQKKESYLKKGESIH